jgi:large subunit ribosomal protein L17
MRHAIAGKKLSRTTDARKQLLRNLARELVYHGEIRTTLAKAKAVQPIVEKLVTKAKEGSRMQLNKLRSALADHEAEKLLLEDVKGRFSPRTSGYTRIVKLGPRLGDGAEEVILSFVDVRAVVKEAPAPAVKKEKAQVIMPEKATKKPTEKKPAKRAVKKRSK